MTYKPTIAALATAPGAGAIAVIRISGPDAIDIAAKIFSGPVHTYKTHTAHYGQVLASNGHIIDSVLLLIMKGPKSYTGENTIEISCHGGPLIVRQVLERIFEAGAKPAGPGEFSLQAFLNGKIDLAQAEAIQELIAAKSELSVHNAGRQLSGDLSKKIGTFQKDLTEIAAICEAWVDFPEEGLEFAAFEELTARLRLIQNRMIDLANTFHEGRKIHEGLSLCLLGAPNVGKSSLMNALLGFDRAIVTNIAGTTRDLLEEDLQLSGLHFRLIDTAGIRDTEEVIEQEGIRRSKSAMQDADLILLLLDASRPLEPGDLELLDTAPRHKTILVWNKIDLSTPPTQIDWPHQAHISAQKRTGLDLLRTTIDTIIWDKGPPSKDEVAITKLRHKVALQNAIDSITIVITGLESRTSAEFVASDMRYELNELATIIGTNVTEDILTSIFSQFCLGK